MGSISSKYAVNDISHPDRSPEIPKELTQDELSKFHRACRDGDIDHVRDLLKRILKADLDKLGAEGESALHIATRNGRNEIVQLLMHAGCSRIILNRAKKMPYEEIKTPEMARIYERPTSTRFHDSDPRTSFETFKLYDQKDVQQPNLEWIRTFRTQDELKEYSLKQQTTAMWFQIFYRLSHTFSGTLNRRDFRADLFDLESDRDFDHFLKNAIPDVDAYKRTKEALMEAEKKKDIVPLLTLYTSEFGGGEIPFYEALNRQLALVSEDDVNTAHFCDRFVYEFYMKSDQLHKRAYYGQAFRGASMNDSELKIYEDLTIDGEKGVLATKTFTSTSKNMDEALKFAIAIDNGRKPVLLVFNVPNRCNSIVSVRDVSEFPHEDEVLITPGNIFKVCRVIKNSGLREIHLEHINTNVSTFKKLIQTIRAIQQRPSLGIES